MGIGVSSTDLEELLRVMDLAWSSCCKSCFGFKECLRLVRGPLSAKRARAVYEAFSYLDVDRTGVVHEKEICKRFVASFHPDVEARRKNGEAVLDDMILDLREVKGAAGRGFSLEDFIAYYEGISAGVDSDEYFHHIVKSVWGLDSSPYVWSARNRHRAYEGSIFVTADGLSG